MGEPDEVAAELDRVFGPESDGNADTRPHKPPLGPEMVVLPGHYARFSIEPVNFIAANSLDFLTGNAIKYLMRAPHKHPDGGRQDYMKAVRYVLMRAKQQAGDPNWWKPYRTNLRALIEEELSYVSGPKAQGV